MASEENCGVTPVVDVESLISTVRGKRVVLDNDLARIYGVLTKLLNRAVKRNPDRFPSDFVFLLTVDETAALRFHSGTSNVGRGGRRYKPYAFTEHGAIIDAIRQLAAAPAPTPPRRRIGFQVGERPGAYRVRRRPRNASQGHDA